MKKSRFREQQIVAILKEAEAGAKTADLCRKHGISSATRLCDLAAERRRFGYRRLNVLLRREGIVVNYKRIYRVYAAAKLQVRKGVKRRVALGRGEAMAPASQPNIRWSLDFVHDTLQNGRRIRTLNVVDDFRRESIAMEVDTSIAGARVARVLDRIAAERGAYHKCW